MFLTEVKFVWATSLWTWTTRVENIFLEITVCNVIAIAANEVMEEMECEDEQEEMDDLESEKEDENEACGNVVDDVSSFYLIGWYMCDKDIFFLHSRSASVKDSRCFEGSWM